MPRVQISLHCAAFLGVVAVVALAACIDTPAKEPIGQRATLGGLAPDFTMSDTRGGTFRLSDHRGKQVVLLDFWSTSCAPCRAQLPQLQALADDDESKGLLVVGVAMDDPETGVDVAAFAKRFALRFPIVLDADATVAGAYDPRRVTPLDVLIDRSGRIVAVHEGYDPGGEERLEADVEKALRL